MDENQLQKKKKMFNIVLWKDSLSSDGQ